MSPQFDQVFQAAMALPEAQRAELVNSLIATLQSSESPLSEEWMQEIERRTADIDEGKVEMIPGEVVREELRAKGSGRV